jgi:hypothetical protein
LAGVFAWPMAVSLGLACSTLTLQLPERQGHQQSRRGMGQMILALIAFAKQSQMFLDNSDLGAL